MTSITAAALEDHTWEALREVIDPEIGVDIVTLGLVYDVQVENEAAIVTFTLTTPGCPMEQVIRSGIMRAVGRIPGMREVQAELVWEPRWNPTMAQRGAL